MGLLVEHGALVNSATTRLITPLHTCAALGKPDCVAFLLAHKAEVNARDENGLTPLHKAAASGSMECVRLLVEHGAQQTANQAGKFPHELAPSAVPQLVEYLKQQKQKQT